MGFSSWLCSSNTKNMLVKIVHPGGRVEFHDRNILAAEIMLRNPRCCVAYPHVFQQPWAIVSPDTTLMLGQKFYVVPIRTIRKLQRGTKYSPSLVQQFKTNQSCKDETEDDGMISACLSLLNKNTPKLPHACLKQQSDNEGEKPNSNARKDREKADGQSREENCFQSLFAGMRSTCKASSEHSSEGIRSSSIGSSETRELTRKRTKDFTSTGESPKRFECFHHWQPNLEIVNEESNLEV